MWKTVLLAVTALILVSNAAALDAELKVVDRTASPENPAKFELEVQNNFNNERTFRISSLLSPAPDSWFNYPYAQKIGAGETKTFYINITPSENSIQQNYNFVLNLRASGVDDPDRFENYVSVDTLYDLKITSTDINKNQFRPGETARASTTVLNTAGSTIYEYRIETDIANETFVQEGSSLESGSKATYNFNFDIPANASPGPLPVTTTIYRNGESRQSVTQEIKVINVDKIEYSERKNDNILSLTGTIEAENTGNTDSNAVINKTVQSYIEPFTSFSRSPDRKESSDTSSTYYWNQTLAPGEKTTVEYTVRYWPPLVLLGLVVAGLLVIKRLHRDIEFSKNVEDSEEGIKVHLELKNSSNHKLENIEVNDFVPDIASVKDDFPMARPVIRKTGDGTRLTWEIDQMKPGEQRVFEYHITPMFEVEGGVVLPEAEIDSDEFRQAKTGKKEVKFKPKN